MELSRVKRLTYCFCYQDDLIGYDRKEYSNTLSQGGRVQTESTPAIGFLKKTSVSRALPRVIGVLRRATALEKGWHREDFPSSLSLGRGIFAILYKSIKFIFSGSFFIELSCPHAGQH